MAEEKESLVERLRRLLFGNRNTNRAEKKERRDEFADFMEEHAEEEKERAAAAREKRSSP